MLKSLRIKNFRSHKKSLLEFVEGINIIVGMSNSGKTNIFRAFNWLRTNRPLGTRFISSFAKDKKEETEVEAVFLTGKRTEGIRVKKSRKESLVYSVFLDGKQIDEFKKVKSDVPDKVLEILRVDNINLQAQLDQYFLIVSSPGEVGREINRIAHLENVDKWIKEFTSKINSTKKEIKSKEIEIEEKEIQLKQFPNINYLDKICSKAEKCEKEIILIEEEISSLKAIIKEMEVMEEFLIPLKPYLNADKDIKKIEEFNFSISEVDKDIFDLGELIYMIENLKIENEKEINKCEEYVLLGEDIKKEILAVDNNILKLNRLIEDLIGVEEDKNTIKKELVDNGELFLEVFKQAKKCPFCKSRLTEEEIDEISSSI